jgi:hypothetical protein
VKEEVFRYKLVNTSKFWQDSVTKLSGVFLLGQE